MFRNESEFVAFCTGQLRETFGKCQYINKNHGDQYQAVGRPDLEGSIFGRHVGIEAKYYPGRFSAAQKGHIKKIHMSGGLAGGLVYDNRYDHVYWLTAGQCFNFSWRDRKKSWRKIGTSKGVDFKFLYRYLMWYFLFYTGDLNIDTMTKGESE